MLLSRIFRRDRYGRSSPPSYAVAAVAAVLAVSGTIAAGAAVAQPPSTSPSAPTAPTSPERKPADATWAPTENPSATIVPGKMRSDREDVPGGFSKADADKAETMEARTQSQTTTFAAPGCEVYWPSPYEVCGAIKDKYNSLGGPNSFLLWPTSNEILNPDGVGAHSTFTNGPIYWSPWGGAHPVANHFFAAWQRNGWEGGVLGYPTSDEILNGDGVGRRQYFDGGTVYWKLNEAYFVAGAIRDKWGEAGWEGGYLGYPISDETGTLDGLGRFNRFEHGVIYWTGAYGAHPVSGGLVNKWAQSGFERGPYGYPTADQQQAGPSWRQDFQFGRMGYPTETAAGVVPEAGDEEPVVPSGRPTTWDEFGVDASLGSAGSAAAGGVGASFNSCVSGQSCLVSNPGSTMPPGTEDPTLDGPVTPASFIPPECTTAVWDATWRMARKNACLVFNSSLEVVNTQGAVVGSIPFNVKTGILSTHRSGEMNQEFRITFGTFVGNVGSPTFKYQPTYTGFGSGQYSVDGPASDSAISAGQVKVLVVKWKEHNMADQDVVARSMLIDFSIGNNSAAITESTSARIRADMFRCDTTMKNSQQNFQQGCVVAAATPQFRLGSDTSEQTGHVQAAVGSGLPGVGTPLHRQADPVTRDINRQTACPAQGAVRDGRRLDGRSCDEYPFASTTEGAATSGGGGRTFNPQCHVPDLGPASGSTGYSVCMIDAAQNSHAGSLLGAFYGTNRVINQDPFKVQAQGGSLPPTP